MLFVSEYRIDDQYTGRIALKDSWDDPENSGNATIKRASSLKELPAANEQEIEAIRNAVMHQEGILLSVFNVLRRVPRRVLMVLKLNDLTRYCIHPSCFTDRLPILIISGVWTMRWRPLIPL